MRLLVEHVGSERGGSLSVYNAVVRDKVLRVLGGEDASIVTYGQAQAGDSTLQS